MLFGQEIFWTAAYWVVMKGVEQKNGIVWRRGRVGQDLSGRVSHWPLPDFAHLAAAAAATTFADSWEDSQTPRTMKLTWSC